MSRQKISPKTMGRAKSLTVHIGKKTVTPSDGGVAQCGWDIRKREWKS